MRWFPKGPEQRRVTANLVYSFSLAACRGEGEAGRTFEPGYHGNWIGTVAGEVVRSGPDGDKQSHGEERPHLRSPPYREKFFPEFPRTASRRALVPSSPASCFLF